MFTEMRNSKIYKNKISITLYSLLLFTAFVSTVDAQRPSYAGPRPTGGLNQKDKYHPQNQVTGVDNRFSDVNNSDSANTIPFGAPQRPPIGWPIVSPQQVYVPLNVNPRPQTPSQPQQPGQPGTSQVNFDNRVSGSDIGGGGAASNAAAAVNPPDVLIANGPLPLDAHGDQALIDYLNSVPLDQRPFWFLNYQAIEAQRNNTNPSFSGAVASRGSFFG